MAESQLTSYEEVPYDAAPLYATHPACTATLATLMGLHPAPIDRCRYLELGCAAGGNLLPMAVAHPESEFVGIDLSPRQIAMGQKQIDDLGLKNIKLQAASIMDVDATWGKFDYIVCHGVYSWVPPEVQDKILAICKELLAPQGVAYVSYNTFPGWHQRRLIREILHYHVHRFDNPETKVGQSRAFLDFLVKSIPQKYDVYRRIIEEETKALSKTADFYIFHEHLEDINTPLYFHQFMARAQAKGLQYLGEALFPNRTDDLPEDVQETLQNLSGNLIDYEQYLDILRDRTFRRTLLVHDDAPVSRTPKVEIFQSIELAALVHPASSEPDLLGEGEEKFLGDDGANIATNHPVFKIALTTLFEAWPASVPYPELIDRIYDKLRDHPLALTRNDVEAALANRLIHCYFANLIGLHLQPFPFTQNISHKPIACPLARYQAASGFPRVVNRRHRPVQMEPRNRLVLQLLDGTRDRAALLAHLTGMVERNDLDLTKDGQPVKDPELLRTILTDAIDESLQILARWSFLIG